MENKELWLSFNGGKDSTVILHLVILEYYRQHKQIPVIFPKTSETALLVFHRRAIFPRNGRFHLTATAQLLLQPFKTPPRLQTNKDDNPLRQPKSNFHGQSLHRPLLPTTVLFLAE